MAGGVGTFGDVVTSELQPFLRDTELERDSVVELRYRKKSCESPGEKGSNYCVGYVVVDSEWSNRRLQDRVYLARDIPRGLLFGYLDIERDAIGEFRVLASKEQQLNCHQVRGFQPPDDFRIAAIIELIERTRGTDNPDVLRRHIGYICELTTNGMTISMDHPSNRLMFSYTGKRKIPYHDIDQYRVLGHRNLW